MTDMKSLEMVHEKQRCTFVWSIEKEREGRIVYINIPDYIGKLEEGEVFPHKMVLLHISIIKIWLKN